MSEEDNMYRFLKERGVSTQSIENLKEDKIDAQVVQVMKDDELEKYIPQYGDRLALFAHINQRLDKTEGGVSVIDRLRDRLRSSRKHPLEHNRRAQPQVGNRNAKKAARQIEIGWIHRDQETDTFKQVRSQNGGGTRRTSVDLDTSMAAVLEISKDIFFPAGVSKKGAASMFHFTIGDQTHSLIDSDHTLRSLGEKSKFKCLRIYLMTTNKHYENNGPDNCDQQNLPKLKSIGVRSRTVRKVGQTENISIATISDDDELPELHGDDNNTPSEQNLCETNHVESTIASNTATSSERELLRSFDDHLTDCSIADESAKGMDSSISNGNQLIMTETPIIQGPPSQLLRPYGDMSFQEDSQKCTAVPDADEKQQSTYTPVTDWICDPVASNCYTTNDTIQFGPTTSFCEMLTDITLPTYPPQANSTMNTPEITFQVNRLQIQDDFICFFKNSEILYSPLKMEFKDELGFDIAGVSREGYTAFWASFYLRSCEGEAARIPIIVRKFEEEEWKSVGRIIAKGYLDHNIFPNMLAPAFMVALIHGEHAVSTELLMESFFDFVAPDEKLAIKAAWNGEELSGEDNDDLLDVLERLGSSTIPSEENMKSCMRQVAHKRIIREPRYALDNMRRTCKEPLLACFPDVQSVQDIYIKIAPSAKKINALFRADPTSQSEAQSIKYLKQFIKGLTGGELRRLLRFFTGSETITVSHIDVSFTHLKGLQRRIIAHTCGPTIELPSTYTCYPDLRVELQTMLEGDCLTYTIG